MLFVGRTDDTSFFQTLFALSALAYPRPVPWVACGPGSTGVWPSLSTRQGGAFFYTSKPPPPALDSVTIGERLAMGYGPRFANPATACAAVP